jgi:hypothetical protein
MKRNTLTLTEFIDEEGAVPLAAAMKTERQKIYAWRSLKAAPRLRVAFQLIVLSRYKLTLDGIYGPYLQKMYGGKNFPHLFQGEKFN